ncbi:hypothetical protein OV207_16680 [Corallococcus sp. BB11-1]|uniref:hypothetical protein n=1 Tax=Corallococcus sp. BB11-1 TaxID=2996783 RepID=UPI0010E4D06B|nr:hypothetical protein [Corallococcus sp. BB11-1]MCY1033107.1 hypothetical protein [Corallococcus sp. BB11-1]RYZ32360.1 MAG: hypothetical protein EOO72_15425 [Myxococcaceae bacterium]
MGLGLAALLLMLGASGCRRSPAPPSPEYEQATKRWSSLYAQKLDDAYLDPATGEIEALLQRVPADSVDSVAAQDLLRRIEEGRARMMSAAAEQQRAVESAQTLPTTDPSQTGIPQQQALPPEEDAGVDAGMAGPQVGSLASELVSGYRGCFQRAMPLQVEGRGVREGWKLSERPSCQLEFPSHADTMVLIEDGRVLALLPTSAMQTVQRYEDGGVVPPDAGL